MDRHRDVDGFDFVMANPPFNVKEVDKEKLKGDPRYPFGFPTTDNANYLWIQTVSFDDCVTMMSGGTPSKANAAFWQGDIPWVSCKDMTSLLSRSYPVVCGRSDPLVEQD